mmetsp:Transcript_23546/g.51096  ORF Transcript_23546/g.51096 Transcript_23546/m.51096 type:complete len:229 (+) Transcript_23546:1465-2151(+)
MKTSFQNVSNRIYFEGFPLFIAISSCPHATREQLKHIGIRKTMTVSLSAMLLRVKWTLWRRTEPLPNRRRKRGHHANERKRRAMEQLLPLPHLHHRPQIHLFRVRKGNRHPKVLSRSKVRQLSKHHHYKSLRRPKPMNQNQKLVEFQFCHRSPIKRPLRYTPHASTWPPNPTMRLRPFLRYQRRLQLLQQMYESRGRKSVKMNERTLLRWLLPRKQPHNRLGVQFHPR